MSLETLQSLGGAPQQSDGMAYIMDMLGAGQRANWGAAPIRREVGGAEQMVPQAAQQQYPQQQYPQAQYGQPVAQQVAPSAQPAQIVRAAQIAQMARPFGRPPLTSLQGWRPY